MVVFAVERSQNSTHPSSLMPFSRELNPSLPLPSPDLEHEWVAVLPEMSPGAPCGYSMWKTGFPASTIGANDSHSLYSTHCSFTEKWTTDVRLAKTSPAFFRPIARPCELVTLARNCTKSIVSSWVRSRPLSLFCGKISIWRWNWSAMNHLTYASTLSGSTASQPFSFASLILSIIMFRTLSLRISIHFSTSQPSNVLPKTDCWNWDESGRYGS